MCIRDRHTREGMLELVSLLRSSGEEVRAVLESTGSYHCPVVTSFQIRITLADKHRVAVVKIRIQVPDTRTPDTHVVSLSLIHI